MTPDSTAPEPEKAPRPPSEFLVAMAHRLPPGSVLDVASGEGRNAIFLAGRGHPVVGVDRSLEALSRAQRWARRAGIEVDLVQADLEHWELPHAAFDVVVNVRYLQRSLIPGMRDALRPGGVVVFETFLEEQLQLGHPRNPDFVLRHNELPALFAGCIVLHYEEGRFDLGRGPVYLARLLARKP